MKISPQHMPPLASTDKQNTLPTADKQKLRKACADFEALLTQQMLSTMRESAFEGEGLFEKSYGEKLFQGMVDQEIATKMANGKGSGFGDMLFQQLSKSAGK